MKIFTIAFMLVISLSVVASVPTEEGLLENLNNADISGNMITVKAMVQNTSPVIGSVTETENSKIDYYKFVFFRGNSNVISLFQVRYSNVQMLNTQIKDAKYISDLLISIKKEKAPEKGMFYAVLMMLTTNNSEAVESFIEKSGVQIVRNRNILNEQKMRLLQTYRKYLANNKGKGDANSPLNPPDPQNKAKVLELFKANTFQRSKNVALVKLDNEFMWLADWKAVKGYFTNEERRLRIMEFAGSESTIKLDAQEYVLFNGTNELPKFIFFKNSKGETAKMQILGLENKTNREKTLPERYEDARKLIPAAKIGETNYSFLY